MIFEIISLLVHLAEAGKKTEPRRKVGEPVVIDCPACGEVRLAHEVWVELREPVGGRMRLYSCSTCQRDFNSEAFQNEGSGVLTLRTWTCPGCRQVNPVTVAVCAGCGYGG